jgi:crotonobetainyl-CoA:carnitine CoA-transferase CaiB-like acyl-CoA transferase
VSAPLAGVRVVDATTTLLGPYCTLILAQLGADVVKVEAPEGDPLRDINLGHEPRMSSLFITLNRGKRSVVLDLKREEGRAALGELVARADVFVHNTKPETARRLGFAYESLAARNPGLVYCAALGFGSDGPYAGKPAYDDIVQAASGLAAVQGRVEGKPAYVRSAIADKTTALFAVYAILAALFARERTGEGQAVEVPMLESVVSYLLVEHMAGMAFEPQHGPLLYSRTVSPYRRPFETQEGFVSVMPYTDRHWAALFEVAGAPELALDPRFTTMSGRTDNIDALYALLESMFAGRTAQEWIELLEPRGVPCTRVNTPEDLFHDPHLEAVGMFELDEDDAGRLIRSVRSPVLFSGSTAPPLRAAPRLGEHTDEVLAEAGLSEAQAQALAAAGVSRPA